MNPPTHNPVLLKESLELLALKPGMSVVDGTLGLGGHSEAILKQIGPKGKLMAFDQDEVNLKAAKHRLKAFAKQISFIHGNFETLKEQLESNRFGQPNAILLDLGLSSPQLDEAERGFSFRQDGPLDMRFDKRDELTAEKIVNEMREKELADLIFKYGEEPRSRKIAHIIAKSRKKKRIISTLELAQLIQSTSPKGGRIHPATLTFQALRIYVNRELEVLEKVLDSAVEALIPGGRIAVISYHSLEDRIVKNRFRHYSKTCICPKELPLCQCDFEKSLYILTRKPIIPTEVEVSLNPRARSAKLRGAERI